jgi:predicted CXXCH cytochrome family protein
VSSVGHSLMNTGRGMVGVTRFALGEQASPAGSEGLSGLGRTPADSLLRKLCAGCHLGNEGAVLIAQAPGCLACHLQAGTPHPRLTARVGDECCFPCHARSSRIALSYAGLAEVDDEALRTESPERLARLQDGRLVEREAPDVHHTAGLGCIDCHTRTDLMGTGGGASHEEQAVDIQCTDCHANRAPRKRRSELPTPSYLSVPGDEVLVTERHGTPLWHIEVGKGKLLLHRKLNSGAVEIPAYTAHSHPLEAQHRRLTCSACHSQWAPQCYRCHVSFDLAGSQWDYLEQRATPGRWREERSRDIRNDLPPLGTTADGRIAPFVPGMILSVTHPDWPKARLRRLFSPIAPHTTGKARSCRSCHQSPEALGLGQGRLARDGGWRFEPAAPVLADGLPADAWTGLDGRHGDVTRTGARPLTRAEMLRILNAQFQ